MHHDLETIFTLGIDKLSNESETKQLEELEQEIVRKKEELNCINTVLMNKREELSGFDKIKSKMINKKIN